MSDLQIEYLRETEEEVSLFNRVLWISTKKTLNPPDVIDQGTDSLEPIPRFSLDPGLAMRVDNTVREMQEILRRAAHLVPDKTSPAFQIDPHHALVQTLKGAGSLDELVIAWGALSKRAELAQKYLDKYDGLYRAETASQRPMSPASTDVGIYDKFPTSKSTVTQLIDKFHLIWTLKLSRNPRMVEELDPPVARILQMKGTRGTPKGVETMSPGIGANPREEVDMGIHLEATTMMMGTMTALLEGDVILPFRETRVRLVTEGTTMEGAILLDDPLTSLDHRRQILPEEAEAVVEVEEAGPTEELISVTLPTIKPEIKVEQLPSWDGDFGTAMEYFWDVGQLAALEGWMPEALGYWLPSRLQKGSAIHAWFSTQSSEKYLGRRWQLAMNVEFENHSFRQEGHEKESPQKFLARRIRAVCMLANSDDGGPVEVYLVMRKAPIRWSTILVLENIRSTEELYEKVNEHHAELVDAVKKDSGEALTMQNIASSLRRMGFNQSNQAQNRRANLTSADPVESTAQNEELESDTPGPPETSGAPADSDGEQVLRQVYSTLKKRQRPPPKGGYPFRKNDHVTTKMGRLPPSPCKVCGSTNHWDKECPDWAVYLERQKRGLLVVSSDPMFEEAGVLYHSAYCVLLENWMNEPSL
ncbi:hypothetical protein FB451DRAFT_1418079 [Mycena latifolia]|nr:hypothetical protein FB451DRAFT_1418079 [Mycena latifolia]